MTDTESKRIAKEVIENGFYLIVSLGGRVGVMDVLTGRIRWQ